MSGALLERLLATPADALPGALTAADRAEIAASWPDWGNQAWAASRAGDHARALAIQALLIRLLEAAGPDAQPALPFAWANHGHLLRAAGQIAAARVSWLQAHTLCDGPPPNFAARADIALNLGTSYWAESDYAAALPWLQRATADYASLPPCAAGGYAEARLADTLAALGQPAAAIEAYRQSHDIFAGLGQPALAAEHLAAIGQMQLAAGHAQAAFETWGQAVAAAEAAGNPTCLYRILEQWAHAQAQGAQDYAAALATARRACAVVEDASDPALRGEVASAHMLAGQMCQVLARWDEAAAHYERAAAAPCDDPQAQALCQEALAGVHGRAGRYDAAQAAYERALAFYDAESSLITSAVRVRGELGQLAWEWGRPEQALAYYTAALAQAEAAGRWSWAGATAHAIGKLYEHALGLPDRAQAYYRRAAAAYATAPDLEGRIEGHRQVGDLALAAGDAAGAVEHYTAARRLARRSGDRMAVAQCEGALAEAHAACGTQADALRHGRAAVRLYRELGLPPQLGQAEMDLGGLHAQFGQGDRAMRAYRRAVRIYLAAGDQGGAALALVSLALTYFGLVCYAAAGRALRQALKLAQTESLENFNTIHTAHLGLGAIADRTGHPRAALRHYRSALALAERYRAAMLHPEFRLAFLGARQNLYARAVVLAAHQGQATAAWGHVEASRSRTFVDLLALTALPRPVTRASPATLTEEARWLDRLRGLLTQSAGESPDYWRQIQEAWTHLEELWAGLGDAEYAALRQGRPASFADVRACLAPRSPRSTVNTGLD